MGFSGGGVGQDSVYVMLGGFKRGRGGAMGRLSCSEVGRVIWGGGAGGGALAAATYGLRLQQNKAGL